MDYREALINDIKNIDLEETKTVVNKTKPKIKVIEESITYFWIRVFVTENSVNIEEGEDIDIIWNQSGESLRTKFVAWGKKGSHKNQGDNDVVDFNPENDKGILCLMINEKTVNYSNDIPFIRTLFKQGRHYEDQVFKRSDLILKKVSDNSIIEYYDLAL